MGAQDGAHFRVQSLRAMCSRRLPKGRRPGSKVSKATNVRERCVHLRQGERSAHPQRLTFFRSTTAASETYRYRARAKSSLGCMQGDRVRPGPRQGRAQPNSRPALSVRRTETLGSRKATRYTIDLEGGGVLDQSQSVQGSGGAAGGQFAPSCVRRATTRRRRSRHLNVWVSADEALFSLRSWRECAKPRSVSRGLRRAAMPSGARPRQPHRFRATGDLVPAAGSGDRQDALHRVRALLRQPRCGD